MCSDEIDMKGLITKLKKASRNEKIQCFCKVMNNDFTTLLIFNQLNVKGWNKKNLEKTNWFNLNLHVKPSTWIMKS
jgi:hypothetical protein